jgi:septum site-determining protein MinC
MPAVQSLKLVNAQMQVLRARLRSVDCDEIRERLRDVRAVGFVDQPAVIDLSAVPGESLSAARWPEILDSFRAVGLNPVALTGLEPGLQRKLATQAGLAPLDGANLELRLAQQADEASSAQSPAQPAPPSSGQSTQASPQPPAQPAASWLPPMVIDRQVRSGQQVYARQRDLIVMAAVSPGAEVIADGNVTC